MMVIILSTFGAIRYFQNNRILTSSGELPPDGWLMFTDSAAGYSFYYPPNARYGGGADGKRPYVFGFLHLPYENGAEIVEFYTLDNPDKLPLEQFIQTEKALKYAEPTELWAKADLSSDTHILKVAHQQALLVKQSEATFPLTGTCPQITYISHNDRVIAAKLCPGRRGIWELGYKANPEAEKLYYQVLDTLQLHTAN